MWKIKIRKFDRIVLQCQLQLVISKNIKITTKKFFLNNTRDSQHKE